MQALTFTWATLSAHVYDIVQAYGSVLSEVGLYKCTVFYVGMSYLSHFVCKLFSPTLIARLLFKNILCLCKYSGI